MDEEIFFKLEREGWPAFKEYETTKCVMEGCEDKDYLPGRKAVVLNPALVEAKAEVRVDECDEKAKEENEKVVRRGKEYGDDRAVEPEKEEKRKRWYKRLFGMFARGEMKWMKE